MKRCGRGPGSSAPRWAVPPDGEMRTQPGHPPRSRWSSPSIAPPQTGWESGAWRAARSPPCIWWSAPPGRTTARYHRAPGRRRTRGRGCRCAAFEPAWRPS